uniref:Endopolyphosphatase n=1 Tax=Kwoniella pini CBS 10737 TaxID=1296096 RepID=A0A1B9HXA0_9TREE|nr:endopolyphosphatase [Kwoniella pini CBS 10737]OCF47892.1 endopolyphosphatase [Kwoniella pini CBS 10737]
MRLIVIAGLLSLTISASCQASSSSSNNNPGQVVLTPPSNQQDDGPSQFVKPKRRPLTGRFLHITDIHPDPHYKSGATFDSGCHRRNKKKKGQKGKGKVQSDEYDNMDDEDNDEDKHEIMKDKQKNGVDLAGEWGTAVSKCDTPMSLVNITFDWLKKEWRDEIDFIVWTGDNARHDIDRSLPRTTNEIFKLNRMVVSKMIDAFGTDIPIVPSIGNNDIWPHNVMAAGPSKLTEEFLHIWGKFIPPDFAHVFERGSYYSVEVIPDTLAVISLNTLFWYDSNTLVDGCGDHSNDPGALEMDWLDVQLSAFRDRGMQVWLTGHVPPHMGYYYDNCYLRYGDLALRYQDTIVGHLFGHMNIDHFFFIDVDELENTPRLGDIGIFGAADTLKEELKKDFQDMPGPKDLKLKDYVVVNVAASVIPTYLPGLRIFTYNISGLGDEKNEDAFYRPHNSPTYGEDGNDDYEDEQEGIDHESEYDDDDEIEIEKKKDRKPGHRHRGKRPKKGDCKKPENEDKPHCVFRRQSRHYSRNSPSRSNKALSPLGYTQFYLPKLNKQNSKPEWEIEYTTYKKGVLFPPNDNSTENTHWKQPLPIPLRFLPGYDDLEINEKENNEILKQKKKDEWEKMLSKITPWKMPDLTIPNYVKLSRKLVKEKGMWDKFQELM